MHNDVRGMGRHLVEIKLSLEDQLVFASVLGSALQPAHTGGLGQAGTGMWFLKHDSYLDWRSGYTQTLVCPGMAGAGKSVMMSFVLDDLWNSYQLQPGIRITQLFCQYQLKHLQTVDHLLSSLLWQLVRLMPRLPETLRKLYAKHEPRGSRPSLAGLEDTLYEVIASYDRTYIVVDALDESGTHHRNKLVTTIQNLQSRSNGRVSIVATT